MSVSGGALNSGRHGRAVVCVPHTQTGCRALGTVTGSKEAAGGQAWQVS